VTRSPVAGRISEVSYQKGKFRVASMEKASTENEQNTIKVDTNGSRVVFSQIAGLIARRIICYKKAGDTVATGERVGLIKFGSRVDIFIGPEWELAVNRGQKVSAGSSVLARRRRNETQG
jgi:phosphatidylserine decarboxylase